MTKFEIILYATSLIVVTASFIASPSMDYLTLVGSLIGVTALIFVAKGHVFGQILTVVFAVFYGIISYFFRYYGEMITYLALSAPIAIASIISWLKHPYKKSAEVAVKRLTKKNILFLSISSVAVTVAFYFILKALGTANLIFSTISVFTSFVAAFLTFLRSPYYGIGYAANDIVLIVLWALATAENLAYLPMIFCFVMFLINDIYGFINWTRMKKRQENNSDKADTRI